MSFLTLVFFRPVSLFIFFFFFNDTATTEIYTLSLHDALPICSRATCGSSRSSREGHDDRLASLARGAAGATARCARSEEHTSELQSHSDLVCRLLLEKKKTLTYDRLDDSVHIVEATAPCQILT